MHGEITDCFGCEGHPDIFPAGGFTKIAHIGLQRHRSSGFLGPPRSFGHHDLPPQLALFQYHGLDPRPRVVARALDQD